MSGQEGQPGERLILYRFHVHDPVFFKENIKVTIQALGFRHTGYSDYENRNYVTYQDDLASVAYWYQTLPSAPLPALPKQFEREIN